MKKEEEQKKTQEETVSRAIPGWDRAKDYIYQFVLQRIHNWIIDHIWQPVLNWVHPFVESVRRLIFSVQDIFLSIWEFLQKVKVSIIDSVNAAKQSVLDYASTAVDWLNEKIGYLQWLVHESVLDAIYYLHEQKEKFIYIFTVAFDRLYAILEGPVHFISDSVIAGFEFWSDKVFELIENYVVEHWEENS